MTRIAALSAQMAEPRKQVTWLRRLIPFAGPMLIVAGVLIVLHDFAFFAKLPSQNRMDTIGYFLTNHCFLGKSLAAGRIPAWNPYSMGGIPFAADPLSGWMYLPAMVLYAALPCTTALRFFIVLQPLLAGLGMYWFLRSEGISRVSSTAGGVALSLALAGMAGAVALPFAALVAWTPMALAATSRFVQAPGWPGRLAWAGLAALAWGQLAGAHMSHSAVVGGLAVVAYLAGKVPALIRGGMIGKGEAFAALAVLGGAVVVLNLAFLLPRLAYLPRSSLSLGYKRIAELTYLLPGLPPRPFRVGHAMGLDFLPEALTPPGAYFSALAPLVLVAAFRDRRRRSVAVALAAYALACFVLSLGSVARALRPVAEAIPLGDFYLHRPDRFGYGVLVPIAVLTAMGMEAWANERPGRSRALMAAPGVTLLAATAFAVGGVHLSLFLVGAAAVVLLGVAVARRPALLLVAPAVMSVDLSVHALLAQRSGEGGWPFGRLREPDRTVASYVQEDGVVRAVRAAPSGRLASLGSGREAILRTTLRSLPYGIEEAQGMTPAQSFRYFAFVRSVSRRRMFQNKGLLVAPRDVAFDLLQVSWVAVPSGSRFRPPGGVPVLVDEGWILYRRPDVPPRASVVSSWTVLPADTALARASSSTFDPSRTVLLETDPGFASGLGGPSGDATYRRDGPQAATIEVVAREPALVLVRNTYDPNWRAIVDGRPAEVLVADYFLQAVPVPAGRHTIRLEYDDPWIGLGLAASGAGAIILYGSALWLLRKRLPVRASQEGEGLS